MRLTPDFYRQDVLLAAPALLGKLLCRAGESGAVLRLRITETEAYRGEEDTACHAHRGKTPRTATLYLTGGAAYVYLCYGIHSLLNVVTGKGGQPQAALIRGVQGFNGPGRVTKALGIDRSLNGEDLPRSERLWLEDDGCRPVAVRALPRVGIAYAEEEDRARLWRFLADAFQ